MFAIQIESVEMMPPAKRLIAALETSLLKRKRSYRFGDRLEPKISKEGKGQHNMCRMSVEGHETCCMVCASESLKCFAWLPMLGIPIQFTP